MQQKTHDEDCAKFVSVDYKKIAEFRFPIYRCETAVHMWRVI